MQNIFYSAKIQSYANRTISGSSMENVILVDENNNEIGVSPKIRAHEQGLLHRAFSIFIVNHDGCILMQRRAAVKYHSAGRWSNTCCGHPRLGEPIGTAARRRLGEEMGIDCELRLVEVFQYKADVDHGLIENEMDHLFVGTFDGIPDPDPGEVGEWTYVSLQSLAVGLKQRPEAFSAWLPLAFAHVYPHLDLGRLS